MNASLFQRLYSASFYLALRSASLGLAACVRSKLWIVVGVLALCGAAPHAHADHDSTLRLDRSLSVPKNGPQPAFAPDTPRDQTPLPRIELGPLQKKINIDQLTEYWIDDSGQASILEVQARDGKTAVFSQRLPAQSHHIQNKALWIRLDPQILDTSARWFLSIGLANVKDATLYWRDATGHWVKLQAGDATAHRQWPMQDRLPSFQLDFDRSANSPYYLRITHVRVPFAAPLTIYRDTALLSQRQTEHFFLGGYFGLVLLMCLGCAVMALVQRDRIYLPYLVYVLALGAWQATTHGFMSLYLWPDMHLPSNTINYALSTLAAAAGMWFVRSVATPSVYMPRLDKVVLLVLAAQVSMLCIDLAHPTPLGLRITGVLTIGIFLLVCTVSWFALLRGSTAVRWIALGFLPIVLGMVPTLMRHWGVTGSSFWSQYGVTMGSALQMPILLCGLMLHNSTRRVARVRTAGLPTHDALTGLSNTYDLLRHIHGAMTRAARYHQQYGLILVELSNHHWFDNEHGRETSDRALVLLATRLQLVARDVDTVGRIDDNHFVLLIEGPCKPGAVAKAGAQIAASALRPSDLLPVGSSIKLRITCAIMPDAQALELGDDANAQLGWLVDSSETLDHDPRKNIRTLNF
jgi:two-component system, sensor histidine kinase LadS